MNTLRPVWRCLRLTLRSFMSWATRSSSETEKKPVSSAEGMSSPEAPVGSSGS